MLTALLTIERLLPTVSSQVVCHLRPAYESFSTLLTLERLLCSMMLKVVPLQRSQGGKLGVAKLAGVGQVPSVHSCLVIFTTSRLSERLLTKTALVRFDPVMDLHVPLHVLFKRESFRANRADEVLSFRVGDHVPLKVRVLLEELSALFAG